MVTATKERVAQQKEPLLGQFDLRLIRVAAERTLAARRAVTTLRRRLTRDEAQLLALCDGLLDIIQEDATGNLKLREHPYLPTEHQLRMASDVA